MKRLIVETIVVLCLLLTFSTAGLAIDIDIGGGIEIEIGAPPRVEFAEPPELVPIPGRYVYFVPDIDFDLFFYHGWWYRPIKDTGSGPTIMPVDGNAFAMFPLR
jgi:hypothetical protein